MAHGKVSSNVRHAHLLLTRYTTAMEPASITGINVMTTCNHETQGEIGPLQKKAASPHFAAARTTSVYNVRRTATHHKTAT